MRLTRRIILNTCQIQIKWDNINILIRIISIIPNFYRQGTAVVLSMQELTTDIFEHISLDLWEWIDARIRYTKHIPKVMFLTQY